MNYEELLKNRRSIRSFTEQEVSKQDLNEILREAGMAPSASNQQPWNFIIIRNRELIQRLSDESKNNIVKAIEANPNSNYKQYENVLRDPKFNVFYNASCLVLIVGKNNYEYFQRDCTLAVAYLMFAATARNLGTCWIGLGDRIEDPLLQKEIGLPDGFEIVAPIIIGYPRRIPLMSVRKKVSIIKEI